MAAKRIRISTDAGTTWFTLPGSSGEKRTESTSFNDTVFGQSFQSEDLSLLMASISGNSYFKGVAGYTASVKISGTSTVMTAEPTALVTGKTYRIVSAAKRMIDYNSPITVLVTAVDQTAQVESIDYLNGTVTFKAAYNPGGAVTITGAYLPLTTLARGRSFSLSQNAAEIDETDYETAQANGGWKTFSQGLKTVSLEIGAVFDNTQAFVTAMGTRAVVIIEISPNNSNNTFFRGFFKRTQHNQQGEVGALEETTYSFGLWVPDGALVVAPFSWYFDNSPLNLGVQKLLNAWLAGQAIDVQYLPNGTTGTQHDAIITECSLANQIDGQNEFRFGFRATGAPTPIV